MSTREGLPAKTRWRLIDRAGNRAAWVELQPQTGRTHQLRAHMAAIGFPIVGDAKYGGPEAFLTGGISRKLHLHARRLSIDGPDGSDRRTAELPYHFTECLPTLGFDPWPATSAARHADPAKTAGGQGAAGGGGRQVARQGAQGRAALARASTAPAPPSQGREKSKRLAIFDPCDRHASSTAAHTHPPRSGQRIRSARGLHCPPPSVSRKVIGPQPLVEAMAALVRELGFGVLFVDRGRTSSGARAGAAGRRPAAIPRVAGQSRLFGAGGRRPGARSSPPARTPISARTGTGSTDRVPTWNYVAVEARRSGARRSIPKPWSAWSTISAPSTRLGWRRRCPGPSAKMSDGPLRRPAQGDRRLRDARRRLARHGQGGPGQAGRR